MSNDAIKAREEKKSVLLSERPHLIRLVNTETQDIFTEHQPQEIRMRFMMFVTSSSQEPPTPELLEAMGKLIERELKAGRLIETNGLMPIHMATQVTLENGEILVTDGPFAESKEVIGGYAVLELPNNKEAVASAVEFMELHKKHAPGWEGRCEVRQIASE